MKRRRQSAWVRASDDQWWQDLQQGHASSGVSGADDGDQYYAAMLYLPDPESRSGWTTHGVDKPAQDEPENLIGFKP